MAWWTLDALRVSRRFGKAVRTQEAGKAREAYQQLLELDRWFDSREPVSAAPYMITRLMTLVHLFDRAKALEEATTTEASLQKWLSEYQSACTTDPFWREDVDMRRWENWARTNLKELQGGAGPRPQ